MAADPPLSRRENMHLLFRLILAPAQILLNVTRCFAYALLRGIPLRHYARCGINRFALALPARLVQAILPTTAVLYRKWVSRRAKGGGDAAETFAAPQLKYDVEPLPDGQSSLLWIGDRSRATKFVYFFHGGGYVCPAVPGHFEWCLRAYVAAAADHPDDHVAVALLQYTLCPPARYPSQLIQAAAGLAHLLKTVRPGNIIIGGDSAGGNLAAGLLGHLLHPHPDAQEIKLDEPLAGAFTVSPWLSARTNSASFHKNGSIDMLSARILAPAIRNLLDGTTQAAEEAKGKGWAMPADIDMESWFKGLGGIIKRLYITVGTQEVFLDQGLAFAEAVRNGNPDLDLRLEQTKHEAHDWILLEGDEREDGDATKRMRAWASTAFWG